MSGRHTLSPSSYLSLTLTLSLTGRSRLGCFHSGGDGGEGGRSDLRGRPVVANGRAQASGRLCPLRQGRRRPGTCTSPSISASAHLRPGSFARSISFVLSAVRYCWVRCLEGRWVRWKGGSVDCFCVPSNGDVCVLRRKEDSDFCSLLYLSLFRKRRYLVRENIFFFTLK